MRKWMKILLTLIIVLAAIQLVRPAKNYSEQESPDDIATRYEIPMSILMVFNDACYNCHSNYTTYPWYNQVQPVGWWMARHIRRARRHLNFSTFAQYSPREAAKKFKEIHEVMEDKSMPIRSYLWMHSEARLSDEQYKKVADWALKMQQRLEASADSVR